VRKACLLENITEMAILCAVEILSPVVVKHGYSADQVRL